MAVLSLSTKYHVRHFDVFPGSLLVSYLVSDAGRSQIDRNQLRVDKNQDLYAIQSHPGEIKRTKCLLRNNKH